MSAGDDPSDTIPPPAGEEDAYSATTKVGAMPAELMARLRADGLLPDESEERRARSRASAKHTLPAIASAVPVPPDSSAPSSNPKTITTAPPPAPDEATLVRRQPIDPAALPPLRSIPDVTDEAAAGSTAPPPAPGGLVPVLLGSSTPPSSTDDPPSSGSVGGDQGAPLSVRQKSSRAFLALALGAILILAFLLALMSHRR